MLTFTHDNGEFTLDIQRVAIAGWAGRDQEGVQHHIDELKLLGVAPPSQTPLFYRVSRETLTHATQVAMLGGEGSGEVETCLVSDAEGTLWVTIASDHTDRKLEAVGVAESKQLCAKPIARHAWKLSEVIDHWDSLEIESEIEDAGKTVRYQQGTLAERLARAKRILFDKTGTLTQGEQGMVDLAVVTDQQPDRALALAAAVEGERAAS